jgi:hypothetical protein
VTRGGRVPGHSLVRRQGNTPARFDEDGTPTPPGLRRGRARCTCGATSEPRLTNHSIQQWMRDHRVEVRAATGR